MPESRARRISIGFVGPIQRLSQSRGFFLSSSLLRSLSVSVFVYQSNGMEIYRLLASRDLIRCSGMPRDARELHICRITILRAMNVSLMKTSQEGGDGGGGKGERGQVKSKIKWPTSAPTHSSDSSILIAF